MNNTQTAISQKVDSYWTPPKSFSMKDDVGIFLVDKIASFTRHKQIPQPFSLTPMNVEESLALSAWEEDIKPDIREDNFTDKNSIVGYSSDSNTVNTYDDDTASVTTCSTTTTTTTSSDYPSVVHVTIADLIKFQERRKSMQDNINNYNMTIDNTSSNYKSKQKVVNFKDEIVESPVESSKNSSNKLPSPSIVSNDSSTIKDNNSSHRDDISITPSLGIPKISREEFEIAKFDKQKKLCGWVKCLWPQPRLPTARQSANRLNSRTLSKRNLNPLTIGIITMHKSVQMILTAIVKGTDHINNGIGKNGQIKFIGTPLLIKGLYDPREYLLLHCPTYHNPPYYNGDPRIPWTEHFLLNKVLPRLADEATRIQNEVGLYLTVKETLLRGFEQYSLYECRICNNAISTEIKTFTYNGIYEHLLGRHNVKDVLDEEMIRVNLRAYISVFYKNLPPNIVFEQ